MASVLMSDMSQVHIVGLKIMHPMHDAKKGLKSQIPQWALHPITELTTASFSSATRGVPDTRQRGGKLPRHH